MSKRVLVRALGMPILLLVIGWLVVQIASGFQTIGHLNQQLVDCQTGAMHCSSAFYTQLDFQIGAIHMFQWMFAIFALLFAVVTIMFVMGTAKIKRSSVTVAA